MSNSRDDMVFTPSADPEKGAGPRRRAVEARKLSKAKKHRDSMLARLRKSKILRGMQTARGVRAARGGMSLRSAAGVGSKVLGMASVGLAIAQAANYTGSLARRAEGGMSGRLLDAMDQDAIYGHMDEESLGATRGREGIEGNDDLMRIVGIQDRVNSQIGQLGTWYRERETARAIGADLIEREPSIDHLGSVMDKALALGMAGWKIGADEAVNAIRGYYGKGPITR